MTTIFHEMKYDLKDHGRSHKAILVTFFLTHSFNNQFSKKSLRFPYNIIKTLSNELKSHIKPLLS